MLDFDCFLSIFLFCSSRNQTSDIITQKRKDEIAIKIDNCAKFLLLLKLLWCFVCVCFHPPSTNDDFSCNVIFPVNYHIFSFHKRKCVHFFCAIYIFFFVLVSLLFLSVDFVDFFQPTLSPTAFSVL